MLYLSTKRAALTAALFLVSSLTASEATSHLEKEVLHIEQSYSLAAAEALLPELQKNVQQADDPALRLLTARTALVAATLHRKTYEEADTNYELRRDLGRKIDDAATTGLGALKDAPESSERYRLEADLWGTMMRTQARASQYRHDFEDATNKALELGPENPNAYITASKRKLFASERRGGNVEEAFELLNKALDLDPEHEMALVFRGLAHEKAGNLDAAKSDWEKALAINPESLMARENLERLAEGRPSAIQEQ